jgi:hypothetical protein
MLKNFLKSVHRSIIQSGDGSEKAVEELVQTTKGKILVARQGDPKKPTLLTYHDLGLNYLSNFQVSWLKIKVNIVTY